MSEEEIKQEIEQVGYKEFYRYYKEKDTLINKQKEILDKIKEDIKEELENVEKDLIMMNLREKERLEWYLELLEEIE